MSTRSLWLLPALLLVACPGNNNTADTGEPDTFVADTGTPPDDTGMATDTGTPPDDTGTPPDDTGTPPDDTGMATDVPADLGPTCMSPEMACGGVCVNTSTDKNHCGACGHACAAEEDCRAGMCVLACPMGQTACGTTCADLQTSAAHCGSCSTACPSGQVCTAGTCTSTCARTVCVLPSGSSACVDPMTDPAHCGMCNRACAAGQECATGTCRLVCPTGQTACGERCADTTTDNTNCGACGHACAGTETCMAGMCRIVCPTGQMLCGTTCADLATDNLNCGTCGNACATGQRCTASACVIDCPAGQIRCGTTCANPATDVMNCGSCGNACGTGQTCAAGVCGCPTGQTACSGACVNLQTDTRNCGSCGRVCGSGQACTTGACTLTCPTGQTACGTTCVDTATNDAHCGMCDHACTTPQHCAASACACPTGTRLCGSACVDTTSDSTNCGACGTVCAAGQLCSAGMCRAMPPANDTRSGATVIPMTAAAVSLPTNTSTANHDASGACGCTGASTNQDVFFRFTLTATEIVYADTIGATWDTALFLQNSAGANLTDPGLTGGTVCSDDDGAGCTLGRQSIVVARLAAGTYYLVLSGCGNGAATIHFQHLPVGNGPVAQIPIATDTAVHTLTGTTSGTGILGSAAGCSGFAGPENTYWFVTCPTFTAQGFTVATCGGATWDTALEQRSAGRSPVAVCNDDYCSTQSSVTSALAAGSGLHAVYLDGFSPTAAGAYTLRYRFTGCPSPQTICSTACVNLQTSAAHCGNCGVTCPSGASCTAGVCACPTGQTNCSGACVNLQTSATHCGACGHACLAGQTCVTGTCRPANDLRANAIAVTLTTGEATVTGSTAGATSDGTALTGCPAISNNVWYRFTLTAREAVYLDTAGSSFDTTLTLVNSAGAGVAGFCNDDSYCTTGGFTATNQSRISGMLDAGTYYVSVGGYGGATGSFTLHVQHLPRTVGSYFYEAPISAGPTNTSTSLVGTSAQTSTCGGSASGEDVRWFVTCGATQQFFSMCRSDPGATYTRRIGTTYYDPSLYLRSAQTGAEVTCNDDGASMGGTDCRGTIDSTMTLATENYGSRLNNVVVPRGLNAVFVDERTGGSGMRYTLRYQIR